MDDTARYRWVALHILPCERELRGWLRARLGRLPGVEVDDIVQEAYARIWQADLISVHNGRAYLYATVRHLLSEYLRRSRIVPIELLGEIDSLNLISDEPGPYRRIAAHQELERLLAIVERLPPRCRRAFELRKFQGLSHREVAQHMGLSEKTIENHLTRALASIASAWPSDGQERLPPRARTKAETMGVCGEADSGAPAELRPERLSARRQPDEY